MVVLNRRLNPMALLMEADKDHAPTDVGVFAACAIDSKIKAGVRYLRV